MTEQGSNLALPDNLEGGCMCGAVRYAIKGRPLATGLCHCDRCRPQSGSAFSTVVFVHREAVTITGEVSQFEDIGTSGQKVWRGSCARCGSPVTTIPDGVPGIIFIKAGGIDENSWFEPGLEMFVVRRRPWVKPVDGAAQFERNPEF